jgi:hypothetical protein
MLTPEEWLTEIDNALEYRRKFGREDKWKSLEDSYLNDPESDAAIGPNLIYSMGDSLMSSLNVPDPEFLIGAEHPAGVDRAPVVESVDNWLVRKLKLKRAIDLATLHCYLNSKGILKLGYDSEFGWEPSLDVGRNQSAGLTLSQYSRKERIEPMNTIPGMPWVSTVQPQDFVVPWGTIFLDDAPWAAHRIVRKNSYFKSDPKYKNTTRLEPQLSMQDYMASYTKVAKDRMHYTSNKMFYANSVPEYNIAWEIHDRMTGKVFVVSPDYDKFLRNKPDALQVAGLPFVDMGFVPHPRSFWSTPQAYYLGQIQHIQFDIALQGEKQRRLMAWKLLARKGVMSREELTKLISGSSGAVGFADTNEPLGDSFMAVPQGSLLDFVMQAAHNQGDAREAMGFGRNQLGEEMESSRRTAREVTFVQEGSERRSGRKFGAIQAAYIELIEKVNKICFEFWKLPRFAMVGNDWVKFTGAELRGDYLYDVTLSTKRSLSKAQRKVEALTVMAQFMQMGMATPQLLQYVIDATADPAFERILTPMLGKGGQRQPAQPAAAGNLPTIPATRK